MRWFAAVALCCLCSIAFAADPAHASVRKDTNIPAEGLGTALETLAKDYDFQVLYRTEIVKDRRTQGAVGSLTSDEALTKVLSGTGLSYKYLDASTVTIVPVATITAGATNDQAQTSPNNTQDNSKETGKKPSQDFRVAQLDQASARPKVSEKKEEKKKEESLEEVVVTGSRLKQATAEGGQEVRTYTQEQIEQSGQSTLSGFLNTLPEVSTALTEFTSQGAVGAAATSVQLRGLPIGTTLILLNGRRVETGGGSGLFFDLNTIPPAAIDRIEIVPEGSSAIYGSDALAGVVNIILKHDFNGFAANAHYGSADDTNEASADATWGRSWSRGSITLVGSYYGRGELDESQRSITANQNFTQFGGPDSRQAYFCNPGTVYSANGGNLTGLNSSQAAIPTGIRGTPSISDFESTAGQQNLCNNNQPIFPESRRGSLMASGTFDVTTREKIFTEVLYSRVDQYNHAGNNLILPSFSTTLPASNPFNPFHEDVTIDEEIPVPESQPFSTAFLRALIGGRGSLSDKWDWELAAWDAQDRDETQEPTLNTAGLMTALNSTNPATALNPFAPVTPAELATLVGYNSVVYRGQTLAVNGFVRGPLLRLPSGSVNIVVGGEYVRDKLGYDPISVISLGNVRTDYHRSENSVFGEMRIPIIGNPVDPAAGEALAVNAAVRHDDYQSFGGKTVPQFSVEWRPTRTLLVRGAYAQAYRAPSLFELHAFDIPASFPNTPIHDPLRGGATELVNLILQDDPLKPETGQSGSVGIVWSPERLEGFKTSVTWWTIKQTNRITELFAQDIVDNESLFPGFVVRGPPEANGTPGPIISVSDGYHNFGELDVRGIDADLSYRYDTAIGQFQPSVSVTEIYRYLAEVTPGAPLVDRLGEANLDAFSPRLKGTVALNWKLGSYSANIDGRYTGKYQDYYPLTSGPNAGSTQTLGNFWIADLNLRYDFGKTDSRDAKNVGGTYISVGAVNLFNSLPPFSMYLFGGYGFDPAEYDIRGRFLYANVGVRF